MPVRLRSDVSLRPLTEEAAPRMLAWMQQPDVAEGIGLTRTPSMERTLSWILSARDSETVRAWMVQIDGDHVGNVVLDQIEARAATGRLSVYLGSAEARNKGIGTTAIYRALEYAFSAEHLYKVWLTVHAENAAAIRAYRKLGFQIEGTLRGALVVNARRLDALYMGLLAQEFLSLRTV
ncbi:MAG: GNAT family protein [Bryobacteraceae bacterium]